MFRCKLSKALRWELKRLQVRVYLFDRYPCTFQEAMQITEAYSATIEFAVGLYSITYEVEEGECDNAQYKRIYGYQNQF